MEDESIQIGTVLILSIVVAVLPSLTYGFALGYTSPVQEQMTKDVGFTTSQFSFFGSILTIGGLLGSLASGKLADSCIGRKGTFWITNAFGIIGWVTIAISKDAWSLDFGRLLVGISIGLLAYVVPIYVAEITPKKYRGGFVFLHMVMICAGITLVYLLGMVVPWNKLAIIGLVPNVLQVFGLFLVPESPRWLAKMKPVAVFETNLQRLRGVNIDISEEAAEIMESISEQTEKITIPELFQKQYVRCLTIGVGIMLLGQPGGYPAIIYYAEAIFKSAGLSAKIGTIGVAAIQIPSSIVAVGLMDRYGRRPLLMGSIVGLILGSLLGGLSFVVQSKFSPYMMLIGILMFSAMYAIGMGGTVDVMLAEMFPMNIKGLAGSLMIIVGWVSSWAMTFVFNFVFSWSRPGTFFILAGVSVATLIFVAALVPETKGLTLEHIAAKLTAT